VIFIGNGGSASIASHQAIDYSKNGGIRSLALNDSAALTCLSDDHGCADVFSRQLEMHGTRAICGWRLAVRAGRRTF
jgi:D-sedoheptulose 7-phosphate isomerase